jgi:hypothetical protein
MSFRKHRLLAATCTLAFLFWLSGCVQENSEPDGPMTGGQRSNTTVSGYMRSGVMVSGH